MHDNSIIVKTNSVSETCVGCIYWIPETVANDGNRPCNSCSRRYNDYYTPTIHTTSTIVVEK